MTAVLESGQNLGLSISFAAGAVVAVTGELDLASAPDLAAVLDALIDRGHPSVTIDCTELDFIDASGLGILATAHARLVQAGGGIRIHGASPLAYRIFEITGLRDVLHVGRANPDRPPALSDAGETDQIAEQASHLAAESAHAEALADTLTRVMVLIPQIITACDGASVTVRRPDYFMTAAASDDTALDLDNLQYADQQGPCLEAATTGVQTHAPVLAEDQRWPSFTPRARGRGIESMLSSPLLVNDRPTGALNLYSRTPDALLPIHKDLASVFATQMAVLLHEPDATTEHEFDQRISDALSSRDVISKAQGVLMERLDIDAAAAYVMLRSDSVRTSTPLQTRAGDVLAETQQRSVPPPDGPAHE